MRPILTIVLISILQFGFSQGTKFEQFIGELNSYAASSRIVIHNDTILSGIDQDAKWTTIKGTYGGSRYCCEEKAFEGNSKVDTFELDVSSYVDYLEHSSSRTKSTLELVGERYVIERITFYEPLPTSAIHYVHVVRYYAAD